MLKGFLKLSALACIGVFAVTGAFAAETVKLRVATYNIAANKKTDVKKVCEQFAEYKVEVSGLQEVDRNTQRNPFNVLESFKTEYPFIAFGKAIDFEGGQYGLGIVSKYELKEVSATPVESQKEEQRIYQRAVIDKDGKKIAIYNTHLSWETTELRLSQLKILKAALDSDPLKYKIVTGDFNIDQNHDEWAIFSDLYSISNGKDDVWLDSFNGTDETMKVFSVDNIIVSKNIKVLDVKMIENKISDHNMIYADLELAE